MASNIIVTSIGKAPSPVTGGWLPDDPKERLAAFVDILKEVTLNEPLGSAPLDPSVQKLQEVIEDSAELSTLFSMMFQEIPYSHREDAAGENYKVFDYTDMLNVMNSLLKLPPSFKVNASVALPFTLLLELPMTTRAGCATFLDQGVNKALNGILNTWGSYLENKNSDSNKHIVREPEQADSWLSETARNIMQERDPNHTEFEKLFNCDTNDRTHLGFKTWDEFFTRTFRNPSESRPVIDKGQDTVTNGCESAPYAIKQKVTLQEKFWLKGQPYSLRHMLGSVELAAKYAGGTVYQAYLSPLTYHRWHSPINGVIKKLQFIPGSYFAVSPTFGFPEPGATPNALPQAYLASVATRALIHLYNEVVGDMIMMPIGMVEVSTISFNDNILDQMVPSKSTVPITKDKPYPYEPITWTPKKDPVQVSKGDELGTFHFGGSTHCLIFGPNVELKFYERAIPSDIGDFFCPLNATLADVRPRPPKGQGNTSWSN